MDKYFQFILKNDSSIAVCLKIYGETPTNDDLIRTAFTMGEINYGEVKKEDITEIKEITPQQAAILKGIKYIPKIELIPEQDYVSKGDLWEFQKVVKELYSNFDGGFGMFITDAYEMHQPVYKEWDYTDDITFSFTTLKPTPRDVATLTWPPNKFNGLLDYEEPSMPTVYEIHWCEMITIVCKHYNITPTICGKTVKAIVEAHKQAKQLNSMPLQ